MFTFNFPPDNTGAVFRTGLTPPSSPYRGPLQLTQDAFGQSFGPDPYAQQVCLLIHDLLI
jgi:hypothetical protein